MHLSHALQPRHRNNERAWEGKSLLVDFDGTLADCRRKDEKSWEFELERVRPGARDAISSVNSQSGRCFITSAGAMDYINTMGARAGVLDVFEKVFDCDDLDVMAVRIGDKYHATAKSYDRVINHLGEKDPLSNCAVIGNDAGLDVPRSPRGVVTVIANMDQTMAGIVRYLEMLLYLGRGSFAEGFDRMCNGPDLFADETKITLIKEDRWFFRGIGTGEARVVLFGMDRNQVMFHLP